MGRMVGKPSISLKLHQIPCNYIFVSTFGGKNELSSIQLVYVHGLSSMHLVCVCSK
jgi:hypothetical protein